MEQTEMTMVGLLEIHAFRSGCMYLSDLHQPKPVLMRIKACGFRIHSQNLGFFEIFQIWNNLLRRSNN